MTTYDFSPLFRSAIGFDRLARLVDSASLVSNANEGYPPYNIEKLGDDNYRLTMAVAGFGADDIEISVRDGHLFIAGKTSEKASTESKILHRGIAARSFERRFALADHMVVEGADIENGLLYIALRREVPETLKPRTIPIGKGAPATVKLAEVKQTEAKQLAA